MGSPATSERESLYKQLENCFNDVAIDDDTVAPSSDDWASMGEKFVAACNAAYASNSLNFDNPTAPYARQKYLKDIEKTVLLGIEKNIIENGLLFTQKLIAKVDDSYLEKDVMPAFLDKRNAAKSLMAELVNEIRTIISKKKPKKGISQLVDCEKRYKEAVIQSLAYDCIYKILDDITKQRMGLLEYARNGDQTHTGISGLIESFNVMYTRSKESYRKLATKFQGTANEPCSVYFPKVHTFAESDEWKKNNKFEELYSSIVPLNRTPGKTCKDRGFGYPPIRFDEETQRGLVSILKSEIRVDGIDNILSEMVNSNPETNYSGLL